MLGPIGRFIRFGFCRIKVDRDYEYLYGINSVQIALNSNRRTIQKIYIADTEAVKQNPRISNIIYRCRKLSINIEFVRKESIEKACPGQPHQNVLLKCSSLKHVDIIDVQIVLMKLTDIKDKKLCVYLDQITDPQNFGAIIRSCYYFQISCLLVAAKNRCPLNSTVSKTSSGALELINIHSVADSVGFIQKWKQQSGSVICTGVKQTNPKIPLVTLDDYRKIIDPKTNKLILIGSEGAGVSPHLARQSDMILTIPKKSSDEFPESLVDSLNVNAAVATILFQLTRP